MQDTFSTTNDFEMILFGEKFIYVYENTQTIQITEKEKNDNNISINESLIKKNKKLLKIDDNYFILFGFSGSNNFAFSLYEINGNYKDGGEFDNLIYNPEINYQIRMINEREFIFSFIYISDFYLYKLNRSLKDKKGGKKNIITDGFTLNTIECDSFDGNYFFCAYSLIKRDPYTFAYTIKSYYSFEKIDNTNLQKNVLTNDASGPSLIKIEHNGKKKFLVCSVEIKNDPSIYYQSFIQEEDNIYKEKIFSIGQGNGKAIDNKQYNKKNPIILKQHNYSIYTLVLMKVDPNSDETETILYISTLDFSINIPITLDQEAKILEKKNILINDYYLVVLKIKSTETEIDVYIREFNLQCEQTELYDITGKNEINLYDLIQNPSFKDENDEQATYLSFFLDTLTYLEVDGSRNMGELLNKIVIFRSKPNSIKLKQNPDLRITENYYIYHFGYNSNSYKILSNFCFFKVINCYESCKKCNIDIAGSKESHQCSECLDTQYKKFITNKNAEGYYNCYKEKVDEVKGYYIGVDGLYHKCDDSCYECVNEYSCDICKEGYYFKKEELNGDLHICYNTTHENYFLDKIEDFTFKGKKINYIYKKCYETCSSCFGEGDATNNKCIKCRNGFKKYIYDSTKCTNDIEKCENFWEVNESNNNIECPDLCSGYIVHENLYQGLTDKTQCTQNCRNIFNPFEVGNSKSLLSYTCDSQKYCITLDYCKLKNLKNNDDVCFRPLQCFDMSDYTKVEETNDEIKDNDANINVVNKRVKLIKYYEYEKIKFSDFGTNFMRNQTAKYKIDLQKEINEHKDEYIKGIDFITSTKFQDFIITIYPLQVEDYVYRNVFEINNLCSINFTKYFQSINYKVDSDNILLIGLIEHKNVSFPINIVNYFFVIQNEKENIFNLKNDLNSDSIDVEISYPLSNYENSNIDDKYSKNLISTIKELHLMDSKLVFYDSKDKIFNDICYPFSSNKNTDMTIEDRINEYLIKISLCENNCALIKIFDKDEYHNPRSLCQCKFKNDILLSESSYSFIYEKNKIKKVLNINALKCVKEVFSPGKIGKNYLFWIFLIILIILVFVLIKVIFCSKNIVEKELENKNTNSTKKINNSTNYNLINNFEKNSNNDFNLKKYKSERKIEDSKDSDMDANDFKKKVFQTTPYNLSESAPPKRIKEIIVNSKNNYTKLPINENQSNLQYTNNINTSIIITKMIQYKIGQKKFYNSNINLCEIYWNYLKKSEIILFLFFNLKNDVDLFIKISFLIFSLSFNFAINCLLLTDNDIHNRYIYAIKHDEIKEIKYIFKEEFLKCFLCAIINVVTKIILIKLINDLLYKFLYQSKNKMLTSFENNAINKEIEDYNNKREMLNKNKSLIFILIIIVEILLCGYISICYIGTFPNTEKGIIIRFIISFCLSIILCSILCLFFSCLKFCGKKYKIKYFISFL